MSEQYSDSGLWKVFAKWAHLPLLMLFFIMYSWKQSVYFFSLSEAFLFWLAGTTGLLLLAVLLNKILFSDLAKATASVSLAGVFFLHYAAIYKYTSETPAIAGLGRHRVLIPIALILWGLWLLFLHFRQKNPQLLTRYLNVLFLILVAGEMLQVVWAYRQGKDIGKEIQHKHALTTVAETPTVTDHFPDIVQIIVDAHTSFGSLEKFWDYHPPLREFLLGKGFYIAENAHSNYDHTGQSISSLFEMDSIPILHTVPVSSYLSDGMARAFIRSGKVPRKLKGAGYQLINYSLFDLPETPRYWDNLFISDPAETGQMLWRKTLGGKLQDDFLHIPSFLTDIAIVDSLSQFSLSAYDTPVFLYAHFGVPHAPYFFDRRGEIYSGGNLPGKNDEEAYLEQLMYTDQKIAEIVTALLQDTTRQPVIIIQGDHGSRILSDPKADQAERFTILNAFFFPDGDYSQLNDSLTTIETYRIVLAKYFL
ncbi:MAG: sulfatase-like hydrolase/transferase [Bacteroidia bacterium]